MVVAIVAADGDRLLVGGAGELTAATGEPCVRGDCCWPPDVAAPHPASVKTAAAAKIVVRIGSLRRNTERSRHRRPRARFGPRLYSERQQIHTRHPWPCPEGPPCPLLSDCDVKLRLSGARTNALSCRHGGNWPENPEVRLCHE